MANEIVDEKAIFNVARQIGSPDARAEYLRQACGADSGLRERVQDLLRAYEGQASFLESPAPVGVAPTINQPASETPGAVIGPYKLIEQIGEGGMGTVWMAQQTEPVKRVVALKLIKAGMDSKQVIARFEAERQALALMDHANIARVLDAGATAAGRPYFVMDLVKGVPITKYCDEHHFTPRQRLELFIPVCQAVQHAHQKGIIHRDLKPSNVLVALYDGKPVPKVIDFGVAKAAGQPLTEKTLVTGFGNIVGTLEYMSPEQAEINQLDIDTRSDIYSLGVLLYELLAGSPPFTRKELEKAGMLEMLRVIREQEPSKPSTKLSTAEGLPTLAANRGTEPAKLTRLVRGELDWIVMKALEKDRNRRYETANGFAMDVQRYLADEAVQACPPSVGYRFRKFARRNKGALVMASVIGVALLLAVGSLGWVVRDQEGRRARTAVEVNQFLQRAEELYADNKLPEAVAEVQKARGVLEASGGDADLGRRVRQWLTDLDTAAKLEEHQFTDDYDHDRYARTFRAYGIDVESLPAEEAAARLADSQIKLDLALALSDWAAGLREYRPQAPLRQRLLALSWAADPDPWRRRLDEALEARDLQKLRELADGADLGRWRTRTLARLGSSLGTLRDPEAAVAFLRKAQRRYPGDLSINSSLAYSLGRLKPPLWEEAIAFRRAALAARPQSSFTRSQLSVALCNAKRLDEAAVECREAIRLKPDDFEGHFGLGYVLQAEGRLDEAIAAYREAIRLRPDLARSHVSLGSALRVKGKLDEAIAAYREGIRLQPNLDFAHLELGLALRHKGLPADAVAALREAIRLTPNYSRAHGGLGSTLQAQGKLEEAVAALREAIRLEPDYAITHNILGIALSDQKKLDEAIACYKKAFELDPKLGAAHINLGEALRVQKKFDQAIACFKTAIELDPIGAGAHVGMGSVLFDQNKLDEAIVWFKKAIELDPKDAAAYYNLGTTLRDQKKADEAIACYKKAIEFDPKNDAAYFNLGRVLHDRGFVNEAIAAYRDAIRIKPDYFTHNNLGLVLADKGKLDEAVAAYRESIRLKADVPEAHSNLGIALSKQRKFDEAIAAFREAIRLKPDYSNAHNNLGVALKEKGKLDDAIAAYREAIRLKADNEAAHNNLGNALKDKGLLDQAVAAYREAFRLKPDYYQPRKTLAMVLATYPDPEVRDPRQAVEHGKKAVELRPQESWAWQALGWAQYRAGEYRQSIETLEKSCKLQAAGTGDYGQWIVLALAHAKLAEQEGLSQKEREQHKAEAHRWYEQADKQLSKAYRVRPGHYEGQAIWDFRIEARELLGVKESKK